MMHELAIPNAKNPIGSPKATLPEILISVGFFRLIHLITVIFFVSTCTPVSILWMYTPQKLHYLQTKMPFVAIAGRKCRGSRN